MKLKLLILSTVVACPTILPCLTSCNKSTISIKGASLDQSKSNIEVDKDSTIYLKPNKNSKIAGIKSITVGQTVLNRMSYKFEYEQTNSLAYKLTIYAKSMTSLDITIEVHNTDIQEIASVSYSGDTETKGAVLKPYSLEVKAKYKDEPIETALAVGEYKVFDENDIDITDAVYSADGYKLDKAQEYKFVFKSAADSSITKEFKITITAPIHDYYYEPLEHSPIRDNECRIKLVNFDPTGHTSISSIPDQYNIDGIKKKVTSVAGNDYVTANACSDIIETLSWECNGRNIVSIESQAFRNLTKLKTFTIPEHVAIIGADAFNNCTSLTKVYIDSQTIANIADNTSGLFTKATSVFIKNGLSDPSGYISTKYTKSTIGDQYTEWTLI